MHQVDLADSSILQVNRYTPIPAVEHSIDTVTWPVYHPQKARHTISSVATGTSLPGPCDIGASWQLKYW